VLVDRGDRREHLVAAIGKPCCYCGEPVAVPTRDHIRPRSKGGTLDGQNKALACQRCNTDFLRGSLASSLFVCELRHTARAANRLTLPFLPGLRPVANDGSFFEKRPSAGRAASPLRRPDSF
jgi:hypothetical protein